MCTSDVSALHGHLHQFSAPRMSELPDAFRSHPLFTRNPVSGPMAKSSKPDPVQRKHAADSDDNEAGPSRLSDGGPDAENTLSDPEYNGSDNGSGSGTQDHSVSNDVDDEQGDEELGNDLNGFGDGMDLEGFSGPKEKVVKPLTPEALAAFKAAKEKTGVIYISRIPPGMRPAKVRHMMSQYGEIGKVYLQQEGE